MEDRVIIFDTTLRDGEQSPGATMNIEEKIQVATQLEKLGVDAIEAGFPIASEGDFEAVRRIAERLSVSSVVGLARCNPMDVDRAWEAVRVAKKPRLHLFLSTSDIHLEYQLKISRQDAMKLAVEMVKRACSYAEDIEFSPMDATRTDPEFLMEILEAVVDAGSHDDQHPRHRGIRHSGRIRRDDPKDSRRHPEHAQGRHQRALP